MPIHQKYKVILDEFEEKLLSYMPKPAPRHIEAAHYALQNPGKRLRPLLLILTCSSLNQGKIQHALDVAVALEMLHNYSLIHDDLPCMDNDDFRRNLPTVHKAYGEATALLAGNYLLTQAFSVMMHSKEMTKTQKVNCTCCLSHYGGGSQLLEGQMLDLSMEGQEGHFYDLVNIYLRKTASLFCCALECGAHLANRGDALEPLLKQVGQKIGLAYQIQNDFKGKKKDSQQHKFTVFSLHTEKQAKLLIKKTVFEALELLNKSGYDFVDLIDLITYIFEYEI